MKNETPKNQMNSKKYSKPALKNYGKLADLTKSGATGTDDLLAGSDMGFEG